MRVLQEERNILIERNQALSMKIADVSTIEQLEKSANEREMTAKFRPIFLKGKSTVAINDDSKS